MIYTKVIRIESGVDYTPGASVLPQGSRPIMGIHVVRELLGHVTIYFLGEPSESLIFPADAFVVGGVYSYAIAKVIFSNPKDSGAFFGCIEKFIQ